MKLTPIDLTRRTCTRLISIISVWHITERTFELWIASRGCSIVYSSIRTFKKDLAKHKPEWMVLVPRVLEKVAAGVQDKFASGSAAVRILSSFFTKVGKTYAKHKKITRSLNQAAESLRSNKDLGKVIEAIFEAATADFRKWEKVQDFYITLEPFAMANGQLTQSYKVKRASVTERYEGELPK